MVKIRLGEIPADGREYTYSRKTGEMNDSLADLIGKEDYQVEFRIKPIGNAYDLEGKLSTSLSEICSTCGYDFQMPVARKFHEILIEDEGEDRKAQSVHGNQSVDFLEQDLSVASYRGEIFNADDYVHEVIAIAEPFYPTCGADGDCLHIEEVNEIRKRLEAELAAADEAKDVGHPAFSVLKELELGVKKH